MNISRPKFFGKRALNQDPPAFVQLGGDDSEAIIARLLQSGRVDAIGLSRADALCLARGLRRPQALVQLGLLSEPALAEIFADCLGLKRAGAERYPAEPVLPAILRAPFLRAARAVPVAIEAGTLVLVTADPADRSVAEAVAYATGLPVRLEVGLPIDVEAALQRLYPEALQPPQPAAGAGEEDSQNRKALDNEAPVIRLVNQIIAKAVEVIASDIHIEPFEDQLRIRYRRDGDLQEAETQSPRLAPAIVSRLKILAKLDIAERRLPQDGRIRMAVRGQNVVFRVATAPCLHGETVVLRLLDRSAVAFDLAAQGHDPQVIRRLAATLQSPNGIVLVTGPTGSGKTTTLYTALLSLNAVERKIVTVEDPIEYQLPGINQMQVKPQINLGFGPLLRSIVRLDPDVIMVGEIRDLETAEIAARAALTGHLVLSTLHTNSAAAAITRLRDMGLQDYLLAAVLRGVLAQRLVRRLCDACKQPAAVTPDLRRRFGLETDTIWRAAGCPSCRGTGYRGRQAIAEFLTVDAQIGRCIASRAGHPEIAAAAVAAGMRTLLQTGMAAVARGETTVEQILRAVQWED
jgi:general secretion pathway protein E